MRHLQYLAVALLFFVSSTTYAGCQNNGAGTINCMGPDGYASTTRNYGGGLSTYSDNQGNTGSIHQYPTGATVVVPQSIAPDTYRGPVGPGSNPYLRNYK